MRLETSNRLKFKIFILLLSSTIDKNSMNESMRKIKFVVNPISGTQSKELVLSLLDEKIDKTKYSWEVVYTTSQEYFVLSIFSSSKLRTNSLLCVPEIGLTTNFIFLILSFMLFLSIVDDKSNINILNFNLLEVSNLKLATFFS